MGDIISKKILAMVIGVAIVAVILLIGTTFAMNGDSDGDKKSFIVKYYKNGSKISERMVSTENSSTILIESAGDSDSERFIGWNTKADLSGNILLPGSKFTVDGDVSFYAMFSDSGKFAIILPENQEGFAIKANPSMVSSGGSSTIEYSLMPSHIDDELIISVNGNSMKLDALNRIYISDIKEDQIIIVTGVYDRREHSITLPEEQIGYLLTSSAEKVHNKQSYTLEYKLHPGYRESSDFSIQINGGDSKKLSNGVLLVEDVRDNHVISVTGVEPIQYNVSSGKNITVLVNGVASTKATVEDRITVTPVAGYTLPKTFNEQIRGKYTLDNGKYRVADNISFPSVLKITAGDNIRIMGSSSESIFVCPGDIVQIGPASGYSLPKNYTDAVKGLNGTTYVANGFSFSDDSILPSIYRVVFNGYNAIYETFYVVEATIIPLPESAPTRAAYYFGGWDFDSSSTVASNKTVNPIWNPMTFDVNFGPNLIAIVGNNVYTFEEGTINSPRTIQIKSNEKVVIKNRFDLSLPDNYGPQPGLANYINGHYEIVGDCSFPGITYIEYM